MRLQSAPRSCSPSAAPARCISWSSVANGKGSAQRELDIGGVVRGETEAIAEIERRIRCACVRQTVDDDVEFTEVGQRRPSKLVVDWSTAHGGGEAVGDFESPD
jgi:hypothetical protein